MARLEAVALLLIGCVPSAVRALPPKDIYIKAGPAVVLLLGSDDGKQGSGGTGSIVAADGKVITNAHVVLSDGTQRPFKIQYVFLKPEHVTGDNSRDLQRRYTASVIAYSPPDELDLALLQIASPPTGLPTIAFADPDQVDVGDEVVAIGHPEQGGLWTLTTGAISTVIANYGHVRGKDVFQTEASVNRGNSGGPLLDSDGNMVGINTMIARQAADGVAITAVNFSLKSSVAVSWLANQGMTLAYAPKGSTQATMIAAAPKPGQVPAAVSPVAQSRVVVVQKAPRNADQVGRTAEAVHAGRTAEPVQKGKTFEISKAQPRYSTPLHPFDLDKLRRSQMQDLEKMMDDMRPKNSRDPKTDGMGLW